MLSENRSIALSSGSMRSACSINSIAAVSLPQPHQDIAAAGQRAGIVRIDRDRASHLCLRFFIPMTGDIDTAENNTRPHLRRVKVQRLHSDLLRAAEGFTRRLGPAHRQRDQIGFGDRCMGGGVRLNSLRASMMPVRVG